MDIKLYCQRNEYTCGPIAVLNLLKLFDAPVKYKDIEYLKDILGTTIEIGTDEHDILDFLRLCGFKIKRSKSIESNEIYLVLYQTYFDEYHYVIIVDNMIINYWLKKKNKYANIKTTIKQMNDMFLSKKGTCIWRIR